MEFEYDPRFTIVDINAREILDSRGNPTVEVEIITDGWGVGIASVPSGASKGRHEAFELRDGDRNRYLGKGVQKAVQNILGPIAEGIVGLDCRYQWEIDQTMIDIDGTENKSNLGANAILAVSIANARAAANTYGLPLFVYLGGATANLLPTPMMNIINGGKHAGNELAIQEFMIVPGGAETFSEALRMGVEVYYNLRNILLEKYGKNAINVGDEGGFAPPMEETRQALDVLVEVINSAGYEGKIGLALDAAADSFYDEKNKVYRIDGKNITPGELVDYYKELADEYPILSIEDPFYEEDYEGFAELTKMIGNEVIIVGDDIFVTNMKRFERGVEMGAGNAILVKVNQIGTLSETIELVKYAKERNYRTIISHRSGETEDNYISDIAVGLETGLIKTGAPARGERTSKYNQLLRIEELLGDAARFSGFSKFKRKPRG
ncbi:MAG: phosphopyruvate hydratase [Candidatus Njordarchaeia archaeon]